MAQLTERAVGIDLVSVDRVRRATNDTPGFLERCFTTTERELCATRHDPAECYAARWAAKEAVVKCLGGAVGPVDLLDIGVVHLDDGAPAVELSGHAAVRARERGITSWLLSLSHTADSAVAIAIGLGSAP